jgi:hypothetical protein
MVTITKTEIATTHARFTLSDGMTIDLSFNEGYTHVSVSGNEGHLIVTPFAHSGMELPTLKLSNFVDLKYTPRKKD